MGAQNLNYVLILNWGFSNANFAFLDKFFWRDGRFSENFSTTQNWGGGTMGI